jgi:hypothetical protein
MAAAFGGVSWVGHFFVDSVALLELCTVNHMYAIFEKVHILLPTTPSNQH